MTKQKIAIYGLTGQGCRLAHKLARELGGAVHCVRRHVVSDAEPFDSLPELVERTFHEFDAHIFVAAAGIVVRCIAPLIQSKASDPAVVCMDTDGAFVVSLLSGHLGGANELAVQCANVTGGQPVITTATDSAGVVSLDMLAKEKNLTIGNIDRVKVVNGALLDKRTVQLFDPFDRLGVDGEPFVTVREKAEWQRGEPGVWVSEYEDCPDSGALRLYPRSLMLGIGCRRGVPEEEISAHISNVFTAEGLSLHSIGGVASVDAKQDEAGLLETAADLGIELVFYAKARLEEVEAPNPSDMVKERMGIPSVSEAAALLLSEGGQLVVEKTKTKSVTLAVARRI